MNFFPDDDDDDHDDDDADQVAADLDGDWQWQEGGPLEDDDDSHRPPPHRDREEANCVRRSIFGKGVGRGPRERIGQRRYDADRIGPGCLLCAPGGSSSSSSPTLFRARLPGGIHCRCPCLVALQRPRLVVVCLARDRYPDPDNVGSPCSGNFAHFWAIAYDFFRVELRQVEFLTEAGALDGANILFVDPCLCSPKLSPAETAVVADFVDRTGGTVLVNGFSNFTVGPEVGDFGRDFKMDLLGTGTIPNEIFRRNRRYSIPDDWAPLLTKTWSLIYRTDEFYNRGESHFVLTDKALRLGAQTFFEEGGASPDDEIPLNTGTAYYPPLARVGEAGKRCGQMLCTGNLHWMADLEAWHGGMVLRHQEMVLALLASSVALVEAAAHSRPQVPSLKELSRQRVLRAVKSPGRASFERLDLPSDLRDYLKGEDELHEAEKRLAAVEARPFPPLGTWQVTEEGLPPHALDRPDPHYYPQPHLSTSRLYRGDKLTFTEAATGGTWLTIRKQNWGELHSSDIAARLREGGGGAGGAAAATARSGSRWVKLDLVKFDPGRELGWRDGPVVRAAFRTTAAAEGFDGEKAELVASREAFQELPEGLDEREAWEGDPRWERFVLQRLSHPRKK